MDGRDDESDKGREDEEDSDDAQAEVDKRVAQMLKNQQQYLHMCSSSAQILQFLSHLVPAISGQVMGLESVTEDSEEASSRSDSASSTQSPATSDDNTGSGCLLWAEPLMTCQLMPSWKPFCGDVRRLPPGVKPEDIKSQHIPTCRGSNISGYHSAVAAAAAAAIARARCPHTANRNSGLGLGSTSKDTSTHASSKEGDPSVSATERHRSEREGKTPKSSQLSRTQMMRSSAVYTPKVPSAADAIRRTKSILAAVTSGRQANNNNNPEEAAGRKSSNQDAITTRLDNRTSTNAREDTGNDRPSGSCDANDHESSAGAPESRPKEMFSETQNGTSPHFPAPILVKAAGVQADTLRHRCEETGDSSHTINSTETVSRAANHNSSESTSNVYEICNQTSQTDEFAPRSPTAGRSQGADRSASNEKILWGRLPGRIDARSSRLVRRVRPNGQLYRHPASTYALQQRNRTQQSVSLGCVEPETQIFPPPPVYLRSGALPSQPPANEQLGLDFKHINIPQIPHRPLRKHTITLAHLKNALKIAIHNLQKINKWTMDANSIGKEPSPHTRSTVSTFTVTEVESLNITADNAEKDSMTSETVGTILSEMINERTDAIDVNGSGDAAQSTADSITEVENITYVQLQSPEELRRDLEKCAESLGASFNDGDKRSSDRNRTNSSCLAQKEILVCRRASSESCFGREDPCGPRPPVSGNHQYHMLTEACDHQKHLLYNCHAETTFIDTEAPEAGDSPVKERDMGTKPNGEIEEESYQTESTLRDTPLLQPGGHSSDQTPLKHSQSTKAQKKDGIALNFGPCLNVAWKFPRAKSAEHSISGAQLGKETKPCRPYSTEEKKTLEGDNDFNNVVLVKNGQDFPPHFPEAGDAVENITVLDNVTNNPYVSSQSGEITNNKHEQNIIKRTEDGKKEEIKLPRKRKIRKAAKRQVFIQTGKSNNASQERSTTVSTENHELLAPAFVQSKNHEAHRITTENSIDESKVERGRQKRVSYFEDRSCIIPLKDVKQQRAEDGDIGIYSHNNISEGRHGDSSSSISDQSCSVVSLPHETQVFDHAKEDMFLNTLERSAYMTATDIPRSASDCIIPSHRRKKGCISKAQHGREMINKPDSKLTRVIASKDVIASKSSCTEYIDIIPGLMSSHNCHTHQKLSGKTTKNITGLSELTDTPLTTIQNKSKAKYSENLDKQLELTETQANIQVSSVMAEKGSPDSSKSSSIQAPSIAQDTAVAAPANAASSADNIPQTASLLNEEPSRVSGGVKSRLRRFFSQCLHPFSHRN